MGHQLKKVGYVLKEKRLERGFSLSDISLQISLSQQQIKNLEDANRDGFPSMAHFMGFLKIYSNFLGTNTNELIHWVQDNSTEVEIPEFTPDHANNVIMTNIRNQRPKYTIIPIVGDEYKKENKKISNSNFYITPLIKNVLIISVIFVFLGIILYFGFIFYKNIDSIFEKVEMEIEYSNKIFQLEIEGSNQSMEDRFYVGDKIIFPYNGKNYEFILANIGENITFHTEDENIDFILEGIGEKNFIISANPKLSLNFYLQDYVSEDQSLGASIKVKIDYESIPFINIEENTTYKIDTLVFDLNNLNFDKTLSFKEANLPYAMNLKLRIKAKNNVFLEYSLDNVRVKKLYNATEQNNVLDFYIKEIMLFSSTNLSSLEFLLQGETFNLDLEEENTISGIFSWVKKEDNRYIFQFIPFK